MKRKRPSVPFAQVRVTLSPKAPWCVAHSVYGDSSGLRAVVARTSVKPTMKSRSLSPKETKYQYVKCQKYQK